MRFEKRSRTRKFFTFSIVVTEAERNGGFKIHCCAFSDSFTILLIYKTLLDESGQGDGAVERAMFHRT